MSAHTFIGSSFTHELTIKLMCLLCDHGMRESLMHSAVSPLNKVLTQPVIFHHRPKLDSQILDVPFLGNESGISNDMRDRP